MKNFCKKLIAAALLIMALTALAACGDGDKLTGTAKLVVDGETDKVYSVNLGDGGFTDADGDGLCDNRISRCGDFTDADGDGLCDNCNSRCGGVWSGCGTGLGSRCGGQSRGGCRNH